MPAPTYRSYENTGRLSAALLHSATSKFHVSEAFLRHGTVSAPAEEFADRLARVIASGEQEASGQSDPGELALRLRQMRVAKGYRTAASAAQAMAWPSATYSAHEAGYNAVSVERLVGYALSFGARPEFAVLGELPILEDKPTGWQDRRAMGNLVVSDDASAWSWLRATTNGLPILQVTDGKLKVSPDRLWLPANYLPQSWTSLKGRGYALLNTSTSGELLIVDPTASYGRTVFMTEAGPEILENAEIEAAATDPVRKRNFNEPFLLGKLLGRISLVIDVE